MVQVYLLLLKLLVGEFGLYGVGLENVGFFMSVYNFVIIVSVDSDSCCRPSGVWSMPPLFLFGSL